ncbi:MAG: diadenylate cyclase CdaA [Fimbriimonadaceae bacterium]|nr:diadenylate cyclase CdaA [Fimbriimonadaceae bacterium]
MIEDAIRQFTLLRTLGPYGVAIQLLDIGLVAFLLYRLLMLVRGTRAWRILLGVFAFLLVLFVSDRLELRTLHWILEKATILGPVALVILFLPELRQAIEGFGKITPLQILELAGHEDRAEKRTIEEITAALAELQQESVGALIVIEKSAKLDEVASNGVPLHADISSSLLGSIFYGENPLHDGAVIIRGDQIVAAACRLPLSENTQLDSHVHMRHRAAVGISEVTDAIAIVISEERATISVAQDGILRRLGTPNDLRELLTRELRNMPESTPHSKRSRSDRRNKQKSDDDSATDATKVEVPR